MEKYAIIRLQGHQYRVEENEVISVDRIKSDLNPDVLLVADEGKIEIGRPTCGKAKVKITVREDKKGEKLYVAKYKAKSRYRKRIGFRPKLTEILIGKISV